jgi:hypothetical protein
MVGIGRREFIAAFGGAAASPLAARAQHDRVRRIGVLMGGDENDPLAVLRFNRLFGQLMIHVVILFAIAKSYIRD